MNDGIDRAVLERIRDRLLGNEAAGAPPGFMRLFYALAETVHALAGHDGDAQGCLPCYREVAAAQELRQMNDAALKATGRHWTQTREAS